MKWFVLILILVSCSTLPPYNPQFKVPNIIIFRGDASFNKEERNTIKDILIIWEQVIENAIHLSVIFEPTENKDWTTDKIPTIYKATNGWKNTASKKLCNGDYLGCAGTITGDIFINYIDNRFPDVIAHEIGHILLKSTWHSSDPESIMYYLVGNLIKQQEIEIIKKVWER